MRSALELRGSEAFPGATCAVSDLGFGEASEVDLEVIVVVEGRDIRCGWCLEWYPSEDSEDGCCPYCGGDLIVELEECGDG